MVKTLSHGDLIWINLNPYLNKRVLGKYIDLIKYYNITDPNEEMPFWGYVLVYNKFFNEIEYSKKVIRSKELLYSPHLFNFSLAYINGKVVTKVANEKVHDDEIILPYVRESGLSFFEDMRDQKIGEKLFSGKFRIFGPKADSIKYEYKESLPIQQVSHLDYYLTIGDPYFLRSRIFIEYLKIFEPNNLNFNLFGKLPEFVNNPEKGGDDRFVFNKYALTPGLNLIPQEYWFKPIPS